LLLDVSRGLPWGVVRAAGAVLEAGEALTLESSDPLADHSPGGMPAPGRLADAARLLIGGHKLKSCLVSGHNVNFPVGQVCHNRSSSWMRFFHHPCTRGAPDLATIFVTTW
jgi:hypothetical protein